MADSSAEIKLESDEVVKTSSPSEIKPKIVPLTPDQIEEKRKHAFEVQAECTRIIASAGDNLDVTIDQNTEFRETLKKLYDNFHVISPTKTNFFVTRQFRIELTKISLTTEGFIQSLFLNYNFLLKKYFQIDITDEDSQKQKKSIYSLIYYIYVTTLNYSDSNDGYGNALANNPSAVNTLIYVLTSLNKPYFDEKLDKDSLEILSKTISTFYNMVMQHNSQTISLMKQYNVPEYMKPFLSAMKERMKLIVLLFMSYVIEEKDSDLYRSNPKTIEFLFKFILQSFKYKSKRFEGLSCYELCRGLAQLSIHQTNKSILIENDVWSVIDRMFKTNNVEIRRLAINILWNLSFQDVSTQSLIQEKYSNMIDCFENDLKSVKTEIEFQKRASRESGGTIESTNFSSIEHADNQDLLRTQSIDLILKISRDKSIAKSFDLTTDATELMNIKEEENLPDEKKDDLLDVSLNTSTEGFGNMSQTSLYEDEKTLTLFDHLATCYISVKGLKWNLQQRNQEKLLEKKEDKWFSKSIHEKKQASKDDKLTPTTLSNIMISYSWAQKDFVRNFLYSRLNELGYPIWIDFKRVENYEFLLEGMAEGIMNATVMIICMSRSYKESPTCRQEAHYGNKLRKNIIPIYVEANYTADGWLDFMISAIQYFRFLAKEDNESVFSRMLAKLKSFDDPENNTGGISEVIIPTEQINLVAQPTIDFKTIQKTDNSDIEKKVKNLTSERIKKWLENSAIFNVAWKPEYDGAQLWFLYELYNLSPDTFFRIVQNEFEIKDLRTLQKLTDAIRFLESYNWLNDT